ncbi:MAG: hypothetical protein JXA07_14215 [Spirochaetes bacterium]|nr:hypothetical protein [Spirochaetota bacterium]
MIHDPVPGEDRIRSPVRYSRTAPCAAIRGKSFSLGMGVLFGFFMIASFMLPDPVIVSD